MKKIVHALAVIAPAGDRIRSKEKRIEVRRWRPEVVPLCDPLIVQNKKRLSENGLKEDPDGVAVALVDVIAVREWRQDDLGVSICGLDFRRSPCPR